MVFGQVPRLPASRHWLGLRLSSLPSGQMRAVLSEGTALRHILRQRPFILTRPSD